MMRMVNRTRKPRSLHRDNRLDMEWGVKIEVAMALWLLFEEGATRCGLSQRRLLEVRW